MDGKILKRNLTNLHFTKYKKQKHVWLYGRAFMALFSMYKSMFPMKSGIIIRIQDHTKDF